MAVYAHDLYKTGDADAPSQIKDRNGEVVLKCCRRCGQYEAGLIVPCTMTTNEQPPRSDLPQGNDDAPKQVWAYKNWPNDDWLYSTNVFIGDFAEKYSRPCIGYILASELEAVKKELGELRISWKALSNKKEEELEQAKAWSNYNAELAEKAQKKHDAALEENARLRKALKPFARPRATDCVQGGGALIVSNGKKMFCLMASDFIAAHAALQPKAQSDE